MGPGTEATGRSEELEKSHRRPSARTERQGASIGAGTRCGKVPEMWLARFFFDGVCCQFVLDLLHFPFNPSVVPSRQRQSASNDVQSIRKELKQLRVSRSLFFQRERDLESQQAQRNQDISSCDNILHGLPRRQTLEQEIATLQNRLRQAQADLKRAEEPPPAVIQSLPEDNDLANSTLFFLYKPDLLRLLSHMTIKAQQILLPWPWYCDSRQELRISMSHSIGEHVVFD